MTAGHCGFCINGIYHGEPTLNKDYAFNRRQRHLSEAFLAMQMELEIKKNAANPTGQTRLNPGLLARV